MLKTIAVLMIRIYQRFISPLGPPVCRFHPTCSHYAVGSIETHGLWRGIAIAAWRILRCNPFVRGGFDPVPERRTPLR
ncbi:MAG: membrane protein insertion efficiency factor YidD [Deltaproteobacteria bacterium]|nr:membrane protein insertion efficiency factor YidD [Deltaproteobacteria bacterium]